MARGMRCCCNAAAFRPICGLSGRECVGAVHSFHLNYKEKQEVSEQEHIKILPRISVKLQSFPPPLFFVFLHYDYI